MIVEVKYYDGDRVRIARELWRKTWYFCPGCGEANVWREEGPGDYDVGAAHLCAACEASFYLPFGLESGKETPEDRQRLREIRRHEAECKLRGKV